jgi:hypothetical protein
MVENDPLTDRILGCAIKVSKALDDSHPAHGLNYLRSTGLPVCLLLNFGAPKLEIRRLVPGPSWAPVRTGEAGEKMNGGLECS